MTSHKIDIRIYYEDTDAGGVVYHANYLKFGERARSEFLRHIGHECGNLEKEFGFIFVVKHIEVEYIRPAFLDDALTIVTTLTEMKNSSFRMLHEVKRGEEILCQLYVTLVCVDTNTIKPIRIPDEIRTGFEKLLKE
jgi:acyl-CoA thioester hydrolase